MSPTLRLLGVTTLLLGLQQLAAIILPEAVRPDLLLLLAMALGLRPQATASLCIAFAVGLGVDALSTAPAGTYALLRGTACAATRLADRRFYLRASLPWGVWAAVYQGIDLLLLLGLTLLVLPEATAFHWTGLLARAPGVMMATGLVAVPVAVCLQRWGLTPTPSGRAAALAIGRGRP